MPDPFGHASARERIGRSDQIAFHCPGQPAAIRCTQCATRDSPFAPPDTSFRRLYPGPYTLGPGPWALNPH
jgi:hypothetical protein